MQITLGADPEFFVLDKEKDTFISAHDLIKGTKQQPHKLRNGSIQVDGTTAEVNITPAKNAKSFSQNTLSIMKQLRKQLKKTNKNADLTILASVTFEKNYFKNLPEDVKAMGCEPDMDAYTGIVRTLTDLKDTTRMAGGHIHIGWLEPEQFLKEEDLFDPVHIEDCSRIVKQLDAVFIVLSYIWDQNRVRRTTYGQKGSFRPKTFGVEYRVLSNAWTKDNELIQWIFNVTDFVTQKLAEGQELFNTDNNKLIDFLDKDLSYTQIMAYYRMLVSSFGIPIIPHSTLSKFTSDSIC